MLLHHLAQQFLLFKQPLLQIVMSTEVKVLGLTVAILSLFLVFTLTKRLFPSAAQCQYNIGCYEVPHSLNHTQQIKARLQNISTKQTQTRSLAYHYRSIISNQSSFNSKALLAARSFERYVKQFTEQQDFRQQDKEILNAITEAEQSYLSCKQEIESNAISKNCLLSWTHYQQCFDQINALHQQINVLLSKEKELQLKIDSEIEKPKKEDPENRPETLAQKIYNQSMFQNQNALRVLRERLGLAEYKLTKTKEQKDKSEDKIIFKQHAYNQCRQNRRIYKHCEEISQQVKNISTGTLKQLKEQIEAKQRLLQQMQEMMLRLGKGETRKMPEHWTQMYQEHLKQLKQMMVDYIQNEQIQRKACGCNQQEERLLAFELQQEQSNLRQFIIEISNIEVQIRDFNRLIYENEVQKEKIIANYQKALKDYQITVPIVSQSHLIRLKKELEENRVKILQTESNYKELESNCQITKKQLSSNLFDLNKVQTCLSKKDYLQKLRKHTAQYIHPQRSLTKLLQTKRELAEALASFDQL